MWIYPRSSKQTNWKHRQAQLYKQSGSGSTLTQPIEWPGSILTQPIEWPGQFWPSQSHGCCYTLYIPLLFELKYTHTYKLPTKQHILTTLQLYWTNPYYNCIYYTYIDLNKYSLLTNHTVRIGTTLLIPLFYPKNQVFQNNYASHSEELWYSLYDVNIGTIWYNITHPFVSPKKSGI